eukprot:gene32260-39833_t
MPVGHFLRITEHNSNSFNRDSFLSRHFLVTEALATSGTGTSRPVEPPSDAVQNFLDDNGSSLRSFGLGGIMGICTGVAFKRYGEQAAGFIGLGFVERVEQAVDLNGDGKVDSKDVAIAWAKFKNVLTYHLLSIGGFACGLAVGMHFEKAVGLQLFGK